MKLKSFLFALCAATVFVACDESTSTLGTSLTDNMDHLEIATKDFQFKTHSIATGDIFSKSSIGYLGTIKDPETGEYITANFMSQFHTLEDYDFPEIDKIVSRNADGEIIADSCELCIFYDDYYGDSLTSMKVTVHEMAKPMTEAKTYSTSYDPMQEEGLIRKDGLTVSKMYALTDMNVNRSKRDNTNYAKNIRIMLNMPYTDKDGKKYNNYGTYVMSQYYKNPENFMNSIKMTNNVIPGFYFESTGGLGSMAYIRLTQLNFYFRYKTTVNGVEKEIKGTTSFAGTEEVMQHTTIKNESSTIDALIADNSCTYLKTPAGIFTEIEFPVDEICAEHKNDTINSAKFAIQRLNDRNPGKYSFGIPSTLLLLPTDSLSSFFNNNDVANYKTSYLASYSSTDNTYTFNNVGSLIKAMQQAKGSSPNWNKAVLVPVATTYSKTASGGSILTKVIHDMSLTNTRLVGGEGNPIKISVIYSKYK